MPVDSVKPVGRMIGKEFGGFANDAVRRIADQLPGSKADELVVGLRQAKLEEAGLSKGVASRVAQNVELNALYDTLNRL